jgi:hypothetical protein
VVIEAEERAAAGRRQSPEAVAEERAGTKRQTIPKQRSFSTPRGKNFEVPWGRGPELRLLSEQTSTDSSHSGLVTVARLPPEPVIQVGRTESPKPAHAPGLYLAPTCHFLERLRKMRRRAAASVESSKGSNSVTRNRSRFAGSLEIWEKERAIKTFNVKIMVAFSSLVQVLTGHY